MEADRGDLRLLITKEEDAMGHAFVLYNGHVIKQPIHCIQHKLGH